jgi:hypothetical protein
LDNCRNPPSTLPPAFQNPAAHFGRKPKTIEKPIQMSLEYSNGCAGLAATVAEQPSAHCRVGQNTDLSTRNPQHARQHSNGIQQQ